MTAIRLAAMDRSYRSTKMEVATDKYMYFTQPG